MQFVQTLDEFEPVAEEYFPGGHAEHVPVPNENTPFLHNVSDVELHMADTSAANAHVEHTWHDVLPVLFANVPLGHCSHDVPAKTE